MNFLRRNFFIVFFLTALQSTAQQYNPLLPPNTYRNADNPYYWKNRPPFPGYWQQDIYYNIKASLNDSDDIITGNLELTYWNNSPDTLAYAYFHLYQNAFLPCSFLDRITRENGVTPVYSKHECEGHGTVVDYVKSDGKNLETKSDNTILKVFLDKLLLPNESVKFSISFKTYYGNGSQRRRMKMFDSWGNKHYDVVHWYPRISVYDSKFGWTADQHLGKEFYGDYGAYDVEFTFPNHYVLDATGNLINRNEVLPDSLRQKLDIKNFADKKWNSPPSVIIPRDGTTKTWKFHAENVHDFALTADPTYRIGEVDWNGIKCVALAQEPHASGWQTAPEFISKVIKTYSDDFGMYAYPKIIAADARDGMEYPMLTLDGGSEPGYHYVIAHEIGHNWFFGMVGNNETYRAALDEGFTQFLSAWSLTKIKGDVSTRNKPKPDSYADKFRVPVSNREASVYFPYLSETIRDRDGFLNTHSDYFNGALGHEGGYRMVYYKTATMLYNLQYVLGDELFLAAMKNYFNQWKFCHPYLEDFRNSIIHFTHSDLNWFFDQWLETDKKIDYGIKCIKKISGDEYEITFNRKGRMQMPLDFTVITNDNNKINYHIPNRDFVKKTDAAVLPKWLGWDKLNPTYTATIKIPSGIEDIKIDESNRLADINMLNNSWRMPWQLKFDSKIYNTPDPYHYNLYGRPDLWYNNYDGLKTGLHLNGNYFNYSHIIDFYFWLNTGVLQRNVSKEADINGYDGASFSLKYSTPAEKFIRRSMIKLTAKNLDGLELYSGGMDFKSRKENNTVSVLFTSLYRRGINSLEYLLYENEWRSSRYNNYLTVSLEHKYDYANGNGDINLSLRTSSIGSVYDYSYLTLNVINKNHFGKFDLHTRVFGQFATGENFADENALFIAGTNPEGLINDKFTRSRAYVPVDWLGYGVSTNHFQQGGGLNLRGYSGYFVPETDKKGAMRFTYKGTTGFSFSAELDFEKL
ncbi:MAG TPA: M1 family metallopeptidase, partial [Bacteroidia bacterium]|nr:M1 family metallopeptidase [Bacteroidia bacterium]